MCEHMRFQISTLREPFITTIKRAHKRPITRVYSNMGPQIEIETKFFATTFEWTLKY